MIRRTVSWESQSCLFSAVLEFLEAHYASESRRYKKGVTIYWQGDPAESLFVVKRGKVKTSCTSAEGREKTYGIFGTGRMIADAEVLLGGCYESTAKALEDTDVYVIRATELPNLLAHEVFSRALVMDLAMLAYLLARQVCGLTFSSVQERVQDTLTTLAEQHGVALEEKVRIDVDITHQELATLVGASRSAVTIRLNQLERAGFLRREGRRFTLLHRRSGSEKPSHGPEV